MHLIHHRCDLGRIALMEEDGAVTGLFFEADPLPAGAHASPTPLLREAVRQMEAYLSGRLTSFDLPVRPAGTPFMRRVWEAVRTIPFGESRCYAQVASAVGSPLAARAVGLANARTPVPVIMPCHRVLGASGALTGYRGGLALKKRLLELEWNTSRTVQPR